MELAKYFESIVAQDTCAVVICDLQHRIIYMNPTAQKRYAKRGGAALIGKSIMDCHNEKSQEMIQRAVDWFAESKDHNIIYTYHNEKENKDVYMVALRDCDGMLIGYYEKHAYRDRESCKPYDFA